MPNLKHYDVYMEKLHAYAQATGIKVVYNYKDEESAYIQSRNQIKLDPQMSQSFEIAVFLHELGHSLDIATLDPHSKAYIRMEKAYAALYSRKFTKKQREEVLATEARAWDYAKIIAKQCKIRLGKWFTNAKDECLESYAK